MQKGTLKSIGNYILLSKIGKGTFASVYSGINQETGEVVAIKQIEISKINSSKETYKNLQNEFLILSKIKHNNIIKLIDFKKTKNNIYFILDYCNGGNLSEYMRYYEKKEGKLLNESDIQKLLRQLILGLEYMHKKNIIHRDLKLENILLNFNDIKKNFNSEQKIQKVDYSKVSLNDSFTLKIADLGFSKNISKELYAHTFLGTPITISPDVLFGNANERKYNTKADLWSLGVITYQLLIGYPPFNSYDNVLQIFQKIKYGKYKIPTNIKISVEAISFINGLLQFYPEKRFNWEQIKSHPFINENVENFHYINLKNIDYNDSNNIVMDTKNCDNLLWINFDTKLNIGLDKIDQKFINENIKKKDDNIKNDDDINKNKEIEKNNNEDIKKDNLEYKNENLNNKEQDNEKNKEIEKKNNEDLKNINEVKKDNLEYKNENLNNKEQDNEKNKEIEKKNNEDLKNINEVKKDNLESKIENLKENLQNNLNVNDLQNNENYEINNFNSGIVIDNNEGNKINMIDDWIDLKNDDEKDEINSVNFDLDFEVEDTFEDLDIDENYIDTYVKN